MYTIARAVDLTGQALDGLEKVGALERETIMNEKRHWVRISRACDNKCIFCHDSDVQNGTFIDVEDCKAEFRRGRENGATRLIISGGEASIHPHFMDLIAYGKKVLGFEKVQTITNGRMWGKKEFCDAAIEAGLNEATFSIHSHIPSLSEKLSGAKNYHAKAVAGLMYLIRTRRVIVNMDIVLTKLNYKHLPEMISYWNQLGVHEFDLLYLVPFGRAMHKDTPNLFIDPIELRPFLLKALKLARAKGLVIWTNRLPPPALEGFEKYIQDPHKIETEMWGRYREFRMGLDKNEPPSCYGDSCPECYVRDLCGNMQRDNITLSKLAFKNIEAEADDHTLDPMAEDARKKVLGHSKHLTVHAKSALEANRYADWDDYLPDALHLDLETMEHFDQLDERLKAHLTEVTLGDARGLSEILACDLPFTLNVKLTKEAVWWLKAHRGLLALTGRQVRLVWPNIATLHDSVKAHPLAAEMIELLSGTAWEVVNVPPCLSGGKEYVQPEHEFDLNLVQADGKIDVIHYAHHYVKHDYYTKSLRCRTCVHDTACPGVHITIVRNFGYQVLSPITTEREPAHVA